MEQKVGWRPLGYQLTSTLGTCLSRGDHGTVTNAGNLPEMCCHNAESFADYCSIRCYALRDESRQSPWTGTVANQSSLHMCTGNYVHINKIMNFGLEWQHLGTDYLSCFTTAAMICAAAKLIKLDTLHTHPWTCYLILLFKYFYIANVWRCSPSRWSFLNWILLEVREKKEEHIQYKHDRAWRVVNATCYTHAIVDSGLCQMILFHVCFDQKPLRNPAVLGRTPSPGQKHFLNHDRGLSFQGEKGSTYI